MTCPRIYWPGGGSLAFEFFRQQVQQPDSSLVGQPGDAGKSRTAIRSSARLLRKPWMRSSSSRAMTPQNWNWGELHTATFRNETLGRLGHRLD